ncbi:unnamed protein product [Rotaria sp. Silwood2]|nr:unnamed protein product [Rotaria sp. Silwood2]CAF3971214.1 unnamed protein product [Rotaria sp. Silwood2]CAF3979004.1 unnamed protein product [Rotaria sp. Silwood2]
MLISSTIILLLLTLSFQVTSIVATPCDDYNITHEVKNDTVQIIFSSSDITRLNRTVQCTANSSVEFIDGHVYNCTGLGYGQDGQIFVGMQHNNGTLETYLQPPTLAYINVPGDRVRLGIERPIGSFDYVIIHCSDEKSYIIFNTSTPLDNSIITVDCSFLQNMPLMSFVLKTMKKDFKPAVTHIVQEVPFPIPFTHSLDSLLLTVIANPAATINLPSIYEFNVIFHDKKNESITYERTKVSNFNLYPNLTFKYGLIPNLKHEIIFTHTLNPIGYALSNSTTIPISNVSYPYEVTNLRIQEDFHSIILSWIDTHSLYDPIEFIVLCNSSNNSMRKVSRNTTYTCQQTTFNEISTIAVQTRVAIPGYTHDRIAVVEINVEQVPDIPLFDVFNKTENTIVIQWNYNNSLISNLFQYKIQCGSYDDFHQIDIRSNGYQCQSLEEGTLYIIAMSLVNLNDTIKRLRSIQANTLLQKCQYRNHYYPPDFNPFRSVIIEWSPPNKGFERIYVYCPSIYYTFEYYEVMSIMYVKCEVTSGQSYNVTFVTYKSGFEPAVLQFTNTAPFDSTTTTTTTMTPETTITTSATTTTTSDTTSTTSLITTTSTTTTMGPVVELTTTTMGPVVELTTTTMGPVVELTTTTMGPVVELTTTTMGPIVELTTTTMGPVVELTTTTMGPVVELTTTTMGPVVELTTTTMKPVVELTTTTMKPVVELTTTTMGPVVELTTTTMGPVVELTTTTMGPVVELTATTTGLTTTTFSSTTPGCSQSELLKVMDELARWRTAAIIAFIIAGFLLLATVCLTLFSIFVVLRNRHSNSDE